MKKKKKNNHDNDKINSRFLDRNKNRETKKTGVGIDIGPRGPISLSPVAVSLSLISRISVMVRPIVLRITVDARQKQSHLVRSRTRSRWKVCTKESICPVHWDGDP